MPSPSMVLLRMVIRLWHIAISIQITTLPQQLLVKTGIYSGSLRIKEVGMIFAMVARTSRVAIGMGRMECEEISVWSLNLGPHTNAPVINRV